MSAAIAKWEDRLKHSIDAASFLEIDTAKDAELADLRAALAAKTEGVAKDARCKCSMSISALGDGCRYCQPQEYIDRLHRQIEDDREESQAAPAMAVEPVAVAYAILTDEGNPRIWFGDHSSAKHWAFTNGVGSENLTPLGRIVPAASAPHGTTLFSNEELAALYKEISGKPYHASDCATSNAPAETPGRCDCDAPAVQQGGEAAPCDRDNVLEEAAKYLDGCDANSKTVTATMKLCADFVRGLKSQPASAHPLMDGKSGEASALQRIADVLRGTGASLPAPPVKGTIESSMNTGLCIALSLVESEISATKGAEKP